MVYVLILNIRIKRRKVSTFSNYTRRRGEIYAQYKMKRNKPNYRPSRHPKEVMRAEISLRIAAAKISTPVAKPIIAATIFGVIMTFIIITTTPFRATNIHPNTFGKPISDLKESYGTSIISQYGGNNDDY